MLPPDGLGGGDWRRRATMVPLIRSATTYGVYFGTAHGVVEAIEFRTTKVRDTEGRLHIIRNGDMKPVINYSRDYTVAVVAVDVAYDADLQRVFAALRQTGAALRHAHSDVLEETSIEGIVAFGASSMTVRTTTRVKPGRPRRWRRRCGC
jgi:small conductance mechanosensitive channel